MKSFQSSLMITKEIGSIDLQWHSVKLMMCFVRALNTIVFNSS